MERKGKEPRRRKKKCHQKIKAVVYHRSGVRPLEKMMDRLTVVWGAVTELCLAIEEIQLKVLKLRWKKMTMKRNQFLKLNTKLVLNLGVLLSLLNPHPLRMFPGTRIASRTLLNIYVRWETRCHP